ncbi:leucyl/phenylalanyl-tRNA--protein transferase [Gemmobacter aquatilis]|uniref:Leucyl/phenylalanyl-tRNA--protein transferase n=1 Tax=Gemmobacter aquatilis TaxID=933059 RepID=A0A1H8BUN0_9RHOB|nr:leucyl/phenylalanyl-tRNA--protein transferase [Gemmobacter aquatilis]SEM86472.1 leucyl/phenylalanyl-tRNA--protein transferase [Gemmobacter aquatilis]
MTDKQITPDLLLRAYAMGLFPMAKAADDPELHWVDPRKRGILPLDGFHISRTLRREILRGDYQITADRDFAGVVAGCADRETTWINAPIMALYGALHRIGHAHSLEMWDGDALIGGVYGVSLGGGFFAESMFSRRRSASKIVLAWLVHRLRAGGFVLCDTQFLTPHLATLGGVEISRAAYHARLEAALKGQASFHPAGYQPSCGAIISSSSAGGGGNSS